MNPGGAPPTIPFGQALAFWFRLGWISFGGPAGQIAILHREIVERRGWVDEARFVHALNFCMLLPGPEAQQLATYIGWMLHRTRGALAAGVLFVLPSLGILIGLSWLYVTQGGVPWVAGVLWGLKPAVVAVVALAVVRVGRRVMGASSGAARTSGLDVRLSWTIAAAAFLGLSVFALPFPAIVAAAALVGWWSARRVPANASSAGTEVAPASAGSRREAMRQALRPALVCLLLWGLSLGALVLTFGADSTLAVMGGFFTQAALVTFGGAYAVLPHVMQAAVETHGWLTAAQMVDGLALGETTPGPLIMVVAFVGYLGGWGQALFGPEHRAAAGAAAAVVATWFTFLPSFLFILAGAPLVERTRGLTAVAAPLSAITAAVVGVILHLAVVLAQTVLWTPAGLDVPALGLTLLAAAVLGSGRLGVVPVILLCGIAGGIGGGGAPLAG